MYMGEWTDAELRGKKRCHCDCHAHPGVYPTTDRRPCGVCGHVNAWGYFPGFERDGWVEYWRMKGSDGA